MNESTTMARRGILQRIWSAMPILLVIAFLLYLRNPFEASPSEPPASHAGVVYDLSLTPL